MEKVIELDLEVDLEALVYVGEDLFALSGKSQQQSDILMFNWTDNDSTLDYVRK